MTDEAFMRAIIEDTDDEAVRLVYADWLEENADGEGQARARLIRVQHAAGRLPEGRERKALEREAKALIKANPAWTAWTRKGRLGRAPVFRLGFPHGVTLSAERFPAVAEAFAAAPTVRAIRFPEASNEVEELAECPHLARLAEADLSEMCECGFCPIEDDLAALFASPHVGNLVRLSISGDRMDAEGARALAASSAFPKLRELDLSHNHLGDAGARVLLRAEWLGRLGMLDLRGNAIGVRAAGQLRKRFGDAVVLE